ncbi:MAG: transporter substrate-binding domain-containing protein [archaeon]
MKKKYFFCFFILMLFLAGCAKETSEKADNKAQDRSLLNVKERGKLLVGTNLPYAPMEYYDESGKMVGLDIDLINNIASEMGVSVEILDAPWESLFDDVKSGKFDVIIDTITITQQRREEMLFSAPYFNAEQAIMMLADKEEVKRLEDLKGKKIGVQKETTGEKTAQQYLVSSSIEGYGVWTQAIPDLKTGKIDAILVDNSAGLIAVKNDPTLKLYGGLFTQEYYGIATKLGNDALMGEIDKILREIKRTGKLDEMKKKWLY